MGATRKGKMMFYRLTTLVVGALLLAACSNLREPSAELEPQARAGNRQIVAHAGDREAKPSGWKEPEWENSVQAARSAFSKDPDYYSTSDGHFGARWVEIDLQLNRHPAAITSSTPYGILYVHHDARCEVITSSGTETGTFRNIETDHPSYVDGCAERLNNMLNIADGLGKATVNRWVLEMKSSTSYKTELPMALYDLLKRRGQRTSEIVSSLDHNMLITLRNRAAQDIVTMNLMRVHWYGDDTNRTDLDFAKQQGFKYVAAVYGGIFTWDVPYAKDIGLNIGGWHWADVSASDGNRWANNLDLDFMISDAIGDLDRYPGWE